MKKCSYCQLQEIRRTLPQTHKIISLQGMNGGVDILVIPKNMEKRDVDLRNYDKYFKAWFSTITTKCKCE